MSSTAFTLSSGAWLLSGLMIGAMGGWTIRSQVDMTRLLRRAAPTPDRAVDQAAAAPEPEPHRRAARRGVILMRAFGLFLFAMSVATLLVVLKQNGAIRDNAQCNRQYNELFANALAERRDTNAQERTALQTALRTIRDVGKLPPEQRGQAVQDAIDGWVASADKAAQQQNNHPFPAAPSELCGPTSK